MKTPFTDSNIIAAVAQAEVLLEESGGIEKFSDVKITPEGFVIEEND